MQGSLATPMSPSIDNDENGKVVNEKQHKGTIGSLLYLTISKLDIIFSVCSWVRYQSIPKESHIMIVKRIFRCLLRLKELGLWYPKSNCFDLIGFSDVCFARCKLDKKSISGACNFLSLSLFLDKAKSKL